MRANQHRRGTRMPVATITAFVALTVLGCAHDNGCGNPCVPTPRVDTDVSLPAEPR